MWRNAPILTEGLSLFPRLAACLCLVLAGAGCSAASVPWQHPTAPKDQWRSDYNSCRRWADEQVGYRESEADSNFRDYDRAQARKRINAYLDMCMRDRGYVPVRPSR
ncbi:hypothetical protein KEC16_05925 [Magnetospirillum sp. J10]|uniref:Lipoprotein n=1 Tax=Magnetospirillum sulfuroxidans TaxID=611300 RepID=A0ABS5I9Z6_9PROT|nr:hypothetical protein [Magnetospirillum sulfuroxidans]